MTAPAIVEYLRQHEIGIRSENGMIFLTPAERVTEQLAVAVALHKSALLRLLSRRMPICPERPAHEIYLRDPYFLQAWVNSCEQAERLAAQEAPQA